ncbi:MAG TPA: ABC transporter ATP-binding protein [Clostridiales bacterium]|nr:ABC transporter ATP-binding protein [Clostridiales bacterium]
MKKTFKYLSRSLPAILVILVLLIIQANCDLALPTYISNIVNIGIQQNGIDSIVPQKIRVSEMDKLKLFMTDDERALIDESFDMDGDVYAAKADIDNEAVTKALGIPMATVNMLQSDSEQGKEVMSKLMENMPQGMVTEDTSFFDLLDKMPPEMQTSIIAAVNEGMAQLKDLDDSIIQQMAVPFVKAEYQQIGIDTDKMQSDYIFNMGMQMIGLAFGIVVCTILVSLLASVVGSRVSRDMRGDVFKKVVAFSNAEYNKFSSASLITRCTNDIQQVQMLIIMVLRMVIYAPILGIGAVTKVFKTGQDMTWVIGVSVSCILAFVIFLYIVAMPKFTILQKLVDKLNLVSREILTGLPVIRAFSREKHEEKRFDGANTDLMKVNLFVNKIMSFMMPFMMLVMNGTCVLIVWVGAGQIDTGNMQVGNLMAFIQYTMQIIMSFLMLSMMSVMLPRAVVSANRIQEVLETKITVNDLDNPKQLNATDKKGYVEFKNVSFTYPGAEKEVIKNISFTSKPGETTAIIGSTGCGKSTLLNLIPRFYDVTQGEILIDGEDIRNISKEALRDRLGYVPQKGMLFSGTIESNIAYGMKEADHNQVVRAATIAQAAEFIDAMPNKYDSDISQGGTNVSGGQRQRLSIARAIAKNPQVYLFDDSFSALDYKTDAVLRKALKDATENSTIIIVAQRISTVLNAEKIIVLDDGEIAGMGSHAQLLKTCEVYQQIAQSQLSKEELGQ